MSENSQSLETSGVNIDTPKHAIIKPQIPEESDARKSRIQKELGFQMGDLSTDEFITKMKNDPSWTKQNSDHIKSVLFNMRGAIFNEQDKSSDRLWNEGFTGKLAALGGTLLQQFQNNAGGGRLSKLTKIEEALNEINSK